MPRRKGLFHITGPRLRVTSKGLKVTAPRARIGGRVGFNISRSGVSGSVRTGIGTFNTKRGLSVRTPKVRRTRRHRTSAKGCMTVVVPVLSVVIASVAWL